MVGAGGVAQSSCRQLSEIEDVELAAICDSHTGRAGTLASEYAINRIFSDFNEIAQAQGIDALYICIPNAFHASAAIAALKGGKHVFLEKPFATSHAEASEIASAAALNDRRLMVGMNQRFTPEAQCAKSLVALGKLGTPYHAKAFWLRRSGIPKLGTWFGNKELAGGGALYDIGVHLLDVALYILGTFDPVAVSGATYTNFGNRGLGEGGWGMSEAEFDRFDVDDFATALITLRDGSSVSLDVSWAMHQGERNRHNVMVYGTEAALSLYPLELYRSGGENGDYEVVQSPRSEMKYIHQSRFRNFVNGLLGREEFCVRVEEALAVQRILDAIYESASRSGEAVSLEQANLRSETDPGRVTRAVEKRIDDGVGP